MSENFLVRFSHKCNRPIANLIERPALLDPKSESRGQLLALFYIPRDEKFDQVKFSDFAADTVRSGQHAILPALRSAVRDQDQEFNNFADIKTLYADKGTPMTTPYNLIPQGAQVDPATQNPLTFIHEYAFPTGPDTSLLTFPLPELIAGASSLLSVLAIGSLGLI